MVIALLSQPAILFSTEWSNHRWESRWDLSNGGCGSGRPSPPGEVSQALAAFTDEHQRWLARLEGDVEEMLGAFGLPPKAFIGFVGTHVHGIILLAISGREVEELKAEALQTLEELLKVRAGEGGRVGR